MKRLLILPLLLLSLSLVATKIYISPTGNDGTGDGSISTPYLTLEAAWADASAGDTIYLRGGTYEFTTRQDLIGKSGTSDNRINIWSYPGEKAIITEHATYNRTTQGQLIYVCADYLYFRDLEICNFEQTMGNRAWSALFCDSTSNSIFERIDYHHNGMSMTIRNTSDNNLILNCDFHHNYDPWGRTPFDGSSYAYGDADGLNISENPPGVTNTIRGCRFWSNADDGLDIWGNDGYVTIDRCWSWGNGYREDGTTIGGDGNGFKLGETVTLDTSVFARTIQYSIAVDNRRGGIVQNGALCRHYVYNNTVIRNGYRGIYFSSGWGEARHVITNNIAYLNTNADDFTHEGCIETTNSWQVATVTAGDFQSLGGANLGAKRQADGSLPTLTSFRLRSGSDLIDTGTDVDLKLDTYGHRVPQNGTPDIGAAEYGNYVLFYNGKQLY